MHTASASAYAKAAASVDISFLYVLTTHKMLFTPSAHLHLQKTRDVWMYLSHFYANHCV